MIVRVTNACKNGEIVLPTIGYAVKAGVELTISDEDFYKNDIQIGIRKGFIVVSDAQGHGNSPFAKKIAVTNLTGRPLALDAISLLVGETSYISEREFNSTNVQTAINAKMIGIQRDEEDPEPEPEPVEDDPEEYYEPENDVEEHEEYEEEDPEPEPEPVQQTRKPAARGKSVSAADVVRLMQASSKQQSPTSKPAKRTAAAPARPQASKQPEQRKVVPKLLDKTAKKLDSKPAKKVIGKAPIGKKPQRPFANAGEDKLERLQRIAPKMNIGGNVNRSSAGRYEDPIDRLTRLAQEIEEDQENGQEDYAQDEEVDFVGDQEDEQARYDAEAEMQEQIEEARINAVGTRMSAWNPHSKRMMGRQEASNKVAKVISSRVKPPRVLSDDGIMTGDVDFSDEGIRTAKKVPSTSQRKGTSKREGLRPVGHRRPEPNAFDDGDGDLDFVDSRDDRDDIVFVDRLHQNQRMQSRPDIISRRQARTRANNIEIG
jgi:hypothetical protein